MVLPIRKDECKTKDQKVRTASNQHFDDLDYISVTDDDDEGNVYNNDVVDISEVTPQVPHFLDYDAVAPQELENSFDKVLTLNTKEERTVIVRNESNTIAYVSGEQLIVDKRFEKDGEISDYELAASGYTKKEFTQDDNNIASPVGQKISSQNANAAFIKRKHFLDENPIPPDYMLKGEVREHRSLDRNFDRQQQDFQRSISSSSANGIMNIRKNSLDREMMDRSSRGKLKEPSYTLSRFIESESVLSGLITPIKNEKYTTWSDSINNIKIDRYSKLHCSADDPDGPGDGYTNVMLGPKVECVYSLLSMLGSNNSLEMSKKFYELSRTSETCATLRRSGCIPLLVQMMHSDSDESVRKCASMSLYNVVHSNPDEKNGRRELKVLRLIEQITDYCNFLKTLLQSGGEAIADDSDRHPLAAISSLMKVSFDEEHRHAMCQLGALQAIPNLVHLDHAVHGPKPEDQCCNSLRRYALMALTNLTFGDENNKAFLCGQKFFMEALVAQLDSAPDDLLQGTASVLRNLSWRADSNMKAVLNEIGTVTALAKAAMKNKSENTLKAILSALWNLSAHCSTNKAEFCSVDGALAFLVEMLTYEGPSKTLKIIENAGGILRNVSSHIAVREDYRQILRERNCLAILLQQLKSESLTVVSNSCGTLWNLSARCPEDQKFLWDNGAVPMLRSLIHSKHNMISEGSSSALKNLLNFRPNVQNQNVLDPITRSMGLKKLPTLNARKQKALEDELSHKNLPETCDNLDANTPKDFVEAETDIAARKYPISISNRLTRSAILSKSESKDSIFSVKSDSVYEKMIRNKSISLLDGNTSIPHQQEIRKNNVASTAQRSAFELQNENEPSEKPIDYSVKYKEDVSKKPLKLKLDSTTKIIPTDTSGNVTNNEMISPCQDKKQGNVSAYSSYQETDLDQPTDFSLRYAENQLECDVDDKNIQPQHQSQVNNGNEMILVLEDSVKCYQTEDTPYVISNAASVNDLRNPKPDGMIENSSGKKIKTMAHIQQQKQHHQSQTSATTSHPPGVLAYGSGSYTPEKPINYCEEGTPGYFSRYESLSSLEESIQGNSGAAQAHKSNATESAGRSSKPTNVAISEKPPKNDNEAQVSLGEETVETNTQMKVNSDIGVDSVISSNLPTKTTATISNLGVNYNSAQETPLMFSRHSSMDSLAEDDVEIVVCDDKSSVVSDFSRLASGIISPSDIPDSPTQTMSHSPRRNSHGLQSASINQKSPPTTFKNRSDLQANKYRLRSVFEDGVNTFQVENTPAQFSSATSLSNLSLEEETHFPDAEISTNIQTVHEQEVIKTIHVTTISEGEEDANNDDMLLATCINIGMNRNSAMVSQPAAKINSVGSTNVAAAADVTTQYCTEDTPALSKVASITNLSIISNSSPPLESRTNLKDSNCIDIVEDEGLSDNVSSNVSECADGGNGAAVLQQCIRDGIQKLKSSKMVKKMSANGNVIDAHEQEHVDPIAMMRRGGNILVPLGDETSKFLVEDSPCNFSIVSGLSNITVDSSRVGPANIKPQPFSDRRTKRNKNDEQIEKWQDDSLSSLSVDSEDDSNLLCQAIAAGCNRPKSNIGFNSNKRSSSLSSSSQVALVVTSACSSISQPVQKQPSQDQSQINGNDSISSIDSSDSNDNQSKSLFEFCIRTGMHKQTTKRVHTDRGGQYRQPQNSHSQQNRSARSNLNSNLHLPQTKLDHQHRDREQKDELLLMECINKGMSKVGGGVSKLNKTSNSLSASQTSSRQQFTETSVAPSYPSNLIPKNGQTTSAAALGQYHQRDAIISLSAPNIVPDVETKYNREYHEGTGEQKKHPKQQVQQECKISRHQHQLSQSRPNASEIVVTKENMNEKLITTTGSNDDVQNINFGRKQLNSNAVALELSFPDQNTSDSNDSFPLEFISSEIRQTEQSFIKTNELQDKHRDPDLMMKSVERLTLDFVSTAELLRTASNAAMENNSSGNEQSSTKISADLTQGGGSDVGTNSNNTWNENTCPNDVSFPSVSITAPIVASLTENNDDDDDDDNQLTTCEDDIKLKIHSNDQEINDFTEITPTNEAQSLKMFCEDANNFDFDIHTSQPNSSLGTDTQCNSYYPQSLDYLSQTNDHEEVNATTATGIKFLVGGEVQSARNQGHINSYFSARDTSPSIAMEANKLAENFNDFDSHSIDLDNIRPPSCMDSLSTLEYFDNVTPRTPQIMEKPPVKPIPVGIVARRAVGNFPNTLHGSLESIHSSCNLDNIKPPSLMDELLDSMLSVASIQSEVVDASLEMPFSMSNYETAASPNGNDSDDNTFTLRSCSKILPRDEETNDGVSLSSDLDFSSAESTPRKNSGSSGMTDARRLLTPKEKRKLVKDRFKTYTITTDIECNKAKDLPTVEHNEILQVEIEEGETISIKQENCHSNDQFKTQTITKELEYDKTEIQMVCQRTDNDCEYVDSLTSADDLSDEMCSIKAMTKQFKFLATSDEHVNAAAAAAAAAATESDYNSMECDQNSETESCSGQNKSNSDNDIENISSTNLRPRIIKPSDKDSGTDLNVSEDLEFQLNAVQVKTVRGRKKAAYISPYRISLRNSTAIAKISNLNDTARTNISGETTAQHRKKNTELPKYNQSRAFHGITPLTKGKSSPNIMRQGTFVKDDAPTADTAVPVAGKSPIKSGSSSPSKLPTKVKQKSGVASKIKTPARFSSTSVTMLNTTGEKNHRLPGFAGIRKSTTVPSLPQRSNSNSSIPISPTTHAPPQLKRLFSTTPSSRSNSNLATNTNNISRPATKISQTQSRIASLWKKVDDVKLKQRSSSNNPASRGSSKITFAQHTTQSKSVEKKNQKIVTTTHSSNNYKTRQEIKTKPHIIKNPRKEDDVGK